LEKALLDGQLGEEQVLLGFFFGLDRHFLAFPVMNPLNLPLSRVLRNSNYTISPDKRKTTVLRAARK
jgi:hypothetical protein